MKSKKKSGTFNPFSVRLSFFTGSFSCSDSHCVLKGGSQVRAKFHLINRQHHSGGGFLTTRNVIKTLTTI